MFSLNKFSLVITTRCNLKCKLCCEYIPQNKPFPDMTVNEAENILHVIFQVCNHITTMHLTGGGEPFLHEEQHLLIEATMKYAKRFDRLMLFTNTVVPIKNELLEVILKYKKKIFIQLSQYGINPEREQSIAELLLKNDVNCRVEKYYGENQPFGGWVDFGAWEKRGRTFSDLELIFKGCAVTQHMHGNWRTRDGKVHWCSRSMRGMELGLIPNYPNDYIDLFDTTSIAEKRAKFETIANSLYLSACEYCSGEQGTSDTSKRIKAAEQE